MTLAAKYGRLTVISESVEGKHRWALCLCSCGVEKRVRASSLVAGFTTSCGCYRIDRASRLTLSHGDTPRGAHSVEYATWRSMRQRCENKKHKAFEYYGGRGITVCARWKTFETFLADMGRRPSPAHSIDRRDNDGNYEPGNCRWATAKQQANNRRQARTAA